MYRFYKMLRNIRALPTIRSRLHSRAAVQTLCRQSNKIKELLSLKVVISHCNKFTIILIIILEF